VGISPQAVDAVFQQLLAGGKAKPARGGQAKDA
jgi:hypothetical protein